MNELAVVIYALASLLSVAAAVLAWAAKLWWGKEFAAAKDEIIKAKDAQIEHLDREIKSLRDLTPMKIREYFLSVREQLEEYNNLLQSQLKDANEEIARRDDEISNLKQEGTQKVTEIVKLEQERKQIADAATKLEQQLATMRQKYESEEVITIRMPRFDPGLLENINISTMGLDKALSRQMSSNIADISKSLSSFYATSGSVIIGSDGFINGSSSRATSVKLHGVPTHNDKGKDAAKENDDKKETEKRDDASA